MPLGFQAERLLTLQVDLPRSTQRVEQVFQRIAAGVAALPDVEAVALTSSVPLTGFNRLTMPFTIEGEPPSAPGQKPIVQTSGQLDGQYLQTDLAANARSLDAHAVKVSTLSDLRATSTRGGRTTDRT